MFVRTEKRAGFAGPFFFLARIGLAFVSSICSLNSVFQPVAFSPLDALAFRAMVHIVRPPLFALLHDLATVGTGCFRRDRLAASRAGPVVRHPVALAALLPRLQRPIPSAFWADAMACLRQLCRLRLGEKPRRVRVLRLHVKLIPACYIDPQRVVYDLYGAKWPDLLDGCQPIFYLNAEISLFLDDRRHLVLQPAIPPKWDQCFFSRAFVPDIPNPVREP